MHVWYVDAGIEDTPEPIYTDCLVLSCLNVLAAVLSWWKNVLMEMQLSLELWSNFWLCGFDSVAWAV